MEKNFSVLKHYTGNKVIYASSLKSIDGVNLSLELSIRGVRIALGQFFKRLLRKKTPCTKNSGDGCCVCIMAKDAKKKTLPFTYPCDNCTIFNAENGKWANKVFNLIAPACGCDKPVIQLHPGKDLFKSKAVLHEDDSGSIQTADVFFDYQFLHDKYVRILTLEDKMCFAAQIDAFELATVYFTICLDYTIQPQSFSHVLACKRFTEPMKDIMERHVFSIAEHKALQSLENTECCLLEIEIGLFKNACLPCRFFADFLDKIEMDPFSDSLDCSYHHTKTYMNNKYTDKIVHKMYNTRRSDRLRTHPYCTKKK